MLLANYAQQNRNTISEWGIAFTNPHAQFKAVHFPKFYCGDHVVTGETNKSAWNNGYAGQYAWHQAPKPGGIGATNTARGTASATATISQGINLVASAEGIASITAALSSVVGLTASAAGVGAATGALVGTVNLVGTAAGAASVTGALKVLAGLVGAAAGSGSASADLKGKLWMSGEITPYTELSPESLAAAVWNAVAASFNDVGTMGEKLNDAGSASNPWTEVIESGYTAAEILRLLAAVAQGDASGLEGSAPVFKSIDGNTDRITATYASGTRTITGRDAT